MATCARCGEDNPSRARFCLGCGEALAGRLSPETRKTVTVLFADLVDSTALGEGVDPESLRSVMNRYYSEMRSTVERHGGVVEKFIGDAVVGIFGVPVAHEDDALRAVRAAVDMQRAMQRVGDELEPVAGRKLVIRVAINSGEVIVGAGVEGASGIVGDPLNTTARMEKAAPPGGIVIGDATRRLVQRSTTTRPIGHLDIAGRSRPLELFQVEDVADEAPRRAFDTALVGRKRELTALTQAFERVEEERTCALFTLLGAAGVGKSRLVREFADGIEGARVLTGRCLPYGDGITFWPVMEVVLEAAEIEERDSQEVALAKIADLLDRDDDAPAVTNLVGQALGLVPASGGQETIFWGLRRLFEAIAKREPLVIVFDDIHWAEHVFLDWLDYVVEWAAEAPLLIVCLARPDLLEARPAWGGGKLNSTTMLLEALREADSHTLLGSLLGGDVSAVASALNPVLEVAGGNPLFLEETIAMLVEDGTLREQDGTWAAARELRSMEIPPTIQALLTARLDQLPHEERAALEVASVAGKVFAAGDVAHLLEDGSAVTHAFESLARKGLVRRDGSQAGADDWYRFKHILIRDAAYGALTKGRRAALHERYARWLGESLGERSAEYEEVIGYHLEQSARALIELGEAAPVAETAAETLSSAARRAADRGDVRAAESLLRRAASLAPGGSRLWAQVHLELGDVLREAGRFREAVATFEAVESSRPASDDEICALAKLRREESTIHVNPQVTAEDTQRVAEDAFETFRRGGNLVAMAEAMRLLAFAYDTMGRSQDSQAAIRRALAYAEEAGDVRRANAYRRTLMGSISWGPIPIPALIEEAQRFIDWARSQSDKRSEARGHSVLGGAYASLGRFDEARRSIEMQKRLHDELGLDIARAWSAFESAWVEILGGDLAAAERELRWACAVCERHGEQAVLPTLLGVLADVVYSRGDVEEAERLAERAAGMAAEDDVLSQVKWRTVRAKIAAQGGDAQACRLVDEAVDLATATEYLDWRALAHLDRARVLALLGRPGADHDLRAAEDLFARKEMSAAIDYARSVAAELTREASSRTGAAAGSPSRAPGRERCTPT